MPKHRTARAETPNSLQESPLDSLAPIPPISGLIVGRMKNVVLLRFWVIPCFSLRVRHQAKLRRWRIASSKYSITW